MTPAQAYRAALEAAAKEIEVFAGYYGCFTLADRIRALPMPQDDGGMVMVPREPTSKIVSAGLEAYHNETGAGMYDAYRAMINAKE